MRNILESVRRRDYDAVKGGAQAIYRAEQMKAARAAFQRFQWRWQKTYPAMVKRLERDLPELLSVFALPKHLWRKLRTTNVIERCFVEVRRRTGLWFALSTCTAWTGLSFLFLVALTEIGKTAPSEFSHKQLGITIRTTEVSLRFWLR